MCPHAPQRKSFEADPESISCRSFLSPLPPLLGRCRRRLCLDFMLKTNQMLGHFFRCRRRNQDIDNASHRREHCRRMLRLEHSCHKHQDTGIACDRRELGRTNFTSSTVAAAIRKLAPLATAVSYAERCATSRTLFTTIWILTSPATAMSYSMQK
jgi:hypothetical protein